jgi:hypothetical protein
LKPRPAAALETQLLLQLVATIKSLNISGAEAGTTLALKCPCGRVILPPIAVMPSIRDRQRGLLRSKIERHLRDFHGITKQTIARVLIESFATI